MIASKDHASFFQLAAMTFGKLSAEEAAAVQTHLSRCINCRGTLSRLSRAELESIYLAGESAPPPDPSAAPGSGANLGTHPPAGGTLLMPAPAAPASPVPPELRNHPKYTKVELLGQGGMGMVFKAYHQLMQRRVAIKVIHSEKATHESFIQRFYQEIRTLSQMKHENIAVAYDAEVLGSLHLLVMEFVEGIDLARMLQKKGQLPVREACFLVKQAADGLQHAFEKQLVHRDLKPANLVVQPDSRLKILDFGLARIEQGPAGEGDAGNGQRATQARMTMGTPEYMAPEQAMDAAKADTRSDLYSLGVTLYQLLAGRLPFTERGIACLIQHKTESVPPIRSFRPDLPDAVVAIVDRLLQKEPANRYQQPGELAEALDRFLKQGAPPRAEPKPAKSAPPKPKPSPAPKAPKSPAGSPSTVHSIIDGEIAVGLAEEYGIDYEWDEPVAPPVRRRKGSEPAIEISPEPGWDQPIFTPPPVQPGLPSGGYAAAPPGGYVTTRQPVVKGRGAGGVNNTLLIVILALVALLGGVLLYLFLVVLPGQKQGPRKASGGVPALESPLSTPGRSPS